MRPGGWRVLRRPAYHNWAGCEYESPRPSYDEMRCDEVWLRPDGSLVTGMITYVRYASCPWAQGPAPISNDYFQERLRPASAEQLLTFDISFEGGIRGRNRDRGRQEEFRPHTGRMRFSPRPFEKVANALDLTPEHGPVPGTPW